MKQTFSNWYANLSIEKIEEYDSLTVKELKDIYISEQKSEDQNQVDFVQIKNLMDHIDVNISSNAPVKNIFDNLQLFVKMIAKSSTFAHKAHKELNKLNIQ